MQDERWTKARMPFAVLDSPDRGNRAVFLWCSEVDRQTYGLPRLRVGNCNLPVQTRQVRIQNLWEIKNLDTRPWLGRRLVRVDGEYVMARRTRNNTGLEVRRLSSDSRRNEAELSLR